MIISNPQARHLFLYLQGLLDMPQKRLTRTGLYELIVRLGYVQVDSIRTVERAHHLMLLARNARYRPELLQALLETDRLLFENWTHDAAMIPTQWYPYWRPRFAAVRQRFGRREAWQRRLGANPHQVLSRVRQHVRQRGPVMARDVTDERQPGVGVWWGWGPSKTALEYLWRTGELAVSRRINFQKVYDVTERVIPRQHLTPRPSRHDYIAWACDTALQRLGCATPGELAAFWDAISAAEARAWCEPQVGNAIREVLIESADGSKPRRAYAPHDVVELLRGLPAAPARVRFLSPFDPLIRDRQRTRRLFHFDYRFEAFVPAGQRQYGYYVLPMLERDRFIGRIDLKCERRTNCLVVKGMWLEPGVRQTKTREKRIAAELERYAAFVGVQGVTWAHRRAHSSV
ncbi:hypothetical protein NKDENANG_03072 [Candidatus Entotheonellaceae bacterium PAL068K]